MLRKGLGAVVSLIGATSAMSVWATAFDLSKDGLELQSVTPFGIWGTLTDSNCCGRGFLNGFDQGFYYWVGSSGGEQSLDSMYIIAERQAAPHVALYQPPDGSQGVDANLSVSIIGRFGGVGVFTEQLSMRNTTIRTASDASGPGNGM